MTSRATPRSISTAAAVSIRERASPNRLQTGNILVSLFLVIGVADWVVKCLDMQCLQEADNLQIVAHNGIVYVSLSEETHLHEETHTLS